MSLSIWFATAALAIQAGSIGALIARKHRNTVLPLEDHRPAITILRPVCGLENNLERCLESSFDLEWPNFEVIFCVADGNDPAADVVRSLLERHPDQYAQLLVGEDRISVNPKMNNLIKGWRSARHDWIVIVDSNVLMPPDQLERMLERWDDETGLVCAPPIGTEPQSFAAHVESVWLNSFQARWQLLADAVGQGFAQGKAMLLNRAIMSDLGGFERLGDAVAEDAAATHLVRSAGLKVRLVTEPFAQPLGARSAGSVWRRQLRWARLRRASFPLYFLPEIAVGAVLPTLCLVSAVVADTLPAVAPLVYLALWYATEILLARSYGWPASWKSLGAMIVRDLALPPLFIAAWFGSDFVWRGNAMTVAEGEPRPVRLRRAVARTRDKARALVATRSH